MKRRLLRHSNIEADHPLPPDQLPMEGAFVYRFDDDAGIVSAVATCAERCDALPRSMMGYCVDNSQESILPPIISR
jgi:hypothetical protein